jgi:hypothetical protein
MEMVTNFLKETMELDMLVSNVDHVARLEKKKEIRDLLL